MLHILQEHTEIQECASGLPWWSVDKNPPAIAGDTDSIFMKMKALVSVAAAKSLQLCPTLCNPTDGSPPGSPVPGILQARTLEWVAISFSIRDHQFNSSLLLQSSRAKDQIQSA